jgi:ferrous iron transport protein A
MMKKHYTLKHLKRGKSGTVVSFNGGLGLINKLNSLGIRRGKDITKISNTIFGGPITIQLDNAKIAIGDGMADKIIVEVDD